MSEAWKCNYRGCGEVVGGGTDLQRHEQMHNDRGHKMTFYDGFTRQDMKPSTKMPAGTRVSFEHEGVARTGMVWSEAPTQPGVGAHRHVIPDGERHAVQVPLKRLTQLEDWKTAAKAPPHLFTDRRAV